MPLTIAAGVFTALALPFVQPLSDSDLANTASMVSPSVQRYAAGQLYYQPVRLPTAEMVDCWWAYTGSELIADASRPALAVPMGLDGSRFDGSALSVDLRMDVVASTRG